MVNRCVPGGFKDRGALKKVVITGKPDFKNRFDGYARSSRARLRDHQISFGSSRTRDWDGLDSLRISG